MIPVDLHSHLLWFLNRGSGIVLVAVLTLATALGVLSASGRVSRRWPRFALQTLHRNVSVIAVALLVAHAATPVLDTYVNHYAQISWLDTFVPFASPYKPLALGLGTLASDLVVVVVLSSIARRRFGHRAWFSLHLLSYAAWGLGLVHGFLIGSDSRTVWGLGVSVAAVVVVAGSLLARFTSPAAPDLGGGRGREAEPAFLPGSPFLAEPELMPEHDLRAGSSRRQRPREVDLTVAGAAPDPMTDPAAGPGTRKGRRATGRRAGV